MAVSYRAGKANEQLQIPKKWKDREMSPERNKVWTKPPNKHKTDKEWLACSGKKLILYILNFLCGSDLVHNLIVLSLS